MISERSVKCGTADLRKNVPKRSVERVVARVGQE
jgi:hypothetical protein